MATTEQSTSVVVPLRTGAKVAGIIPTTAEEVFRIAKAIAVSGMAPRGMEKPEQLAIAIMHGMEIGLPPMQAVQRIAIVNGRPCLWGDSIPALLWSRGFLMAEHMEGEGTERCAVCLIKRPDGTAVERRFSVADAMQAGLWGKVGPWKQYPERMLQMRARGFAARDGAADALAGLYVAEEMQDVVDITPRKSSAQAKRDGTDLTFNMLRSVIQNADSIEALDQVIEKYRATIDELPQRWHEMIRDEYELRMKDLKAAQGE